MTYKFHNPNRLSLTIILWTLALIATITPPASATGTTSPVQVQMGGNRTVGRILSLELVVNSVQLVSSRGTTVTLVSRPYTMEQSHLAASSEVVGRADVPFGIYTRAVINAANPHVVFLDNFGNIREARWTVATTSSIALPQSITITSAPSVVRITLDLASLLKFDANQQTMLRGQPTFSVSQLSPARIGVDAEVAGEIEGSVGKAVAVTASSFTLADSVSGLTTTYMTDTHTGYNGVSLATMLNLIVRVHSTIRKDGQNVAQEVSVAGSGQGSVVTGVITDYTGGRVAVQQIYGSGATTTALGAYGTLALDSTTAFQMDSRGMDLTGISLSFNAANLVAGQRIQFASRGAVHTNTSAGPSLTQVLTARLQLQTIVGTVSNISVAPNGSASFDLALPANDGSALATLCEGASLVRIVTQPLTKSSFLLTEGQHVRVRGLLLFDASSSGLQSSDFQSNGARVYVSVPRNTSDYYMIARSLQLDRSHN